MRPYSLLLLLLLAPQAFAFSGSQVVVNAEPEASNTHTITDSLVSQLQCSGLDHDTFLLSTRPDAFSVDRQLPLENWTSTLNMSHCWALSHAQRMIYFMGRFGQTIDPNGPAHDDYLRTVLDTISGSKDGAPVVFPVSTMTDLYGSLVAGIASGDESGHNLNNQLDGYQLSRFLNPVNFFDFILGGDRDRSDSDNTATYKTLLNDLAQGRLPIVVIRPELADQHVVLVKRVQEAADGTYSFTVYDSNFPTKENDFSYDPSSDQFTAPDIIGPMGESDPTAPIGLFVTDESIMDHIQDSLFNYYKGRCDALQKQ